MRQQSEAVSVDPDLLGIIPQYFDNIREEVGQLEGLAGIERMAETGRFGHSLKGTGAAFGFPRLTELGREVEEAAKGGDAEAALRGTKAILAYIDTVAYRAG